VGDALVTQADRASPVAVVGGHTFKSITTGGYTSCALDLAGRAWCWGWDAWGQAGDGADTQTEKRIPVRVAGGHQFISIAAGFGTTCAVDTRRRAWCWGSDAYGEVGDGESSQSHDSPVAVAGGRTVSAVAPGGEHACALDLQGKAWCWGRDYGGQVGDGAANVADKTVPVPVSGGRALAAITAGTVHSCALDDSATAWCWGVDENGQIGDAEPGGYRHAPIAVSGGTAWKVP
jgi:alpha-tubulin suppressor-like RCC1 family protein